MAYIVKQRSQSKFNSNNKKPSAPARPKKKEMIFMVTPNFTAPRYENGETRDMEMPYDQIADTLSSLTNDGIFDVLTQNVSVPRSLLTGDADKTGTAVVGYINSFNFPDAHDEPATVKITIFGTHVESIEKMSDKLVLRPRIVTNNNGDFKSFNGFMLE